MKSYSMQLSLVALCRIKQVLNENLHDLVFKLCLKWINNIRMLWIRQKLYAFYEEA
jgi:hypothetical protein